MHEPYNKDKRFSAKSGAPSQGGTDYGYLVEARVDLSDPEQICGHLLDNRWRTIYFTKNQLGVPNQCSADAVNVLGLHTYHAAEALRYWFMAEAQNFRGWGIGLETRLRCYKVTYKLDSFKELFPEDMEEMETGEQDKTLPAA